jgi:hypothetical protein
MQTAISQSNLRFASHRLHKGATVHNISNIYISVFAVFSQKNIEIYLFI